MAHTSHTPQQPPAPTCLLPLPDIERRTGLKKTKLYEMMGKGEFPLSIKIGKRALWPSPAVDAWINKQIESLSEHA